MSHTWTNKHARDNPDPLKRPIKAAQRAKRDQRALSADLRQRYDVCSATTITAADWWATVQYMHIPSPLREIRMCDGAGYVNSGGRFSHYPSMGAGPDYGSVPMPIG